MGKKEYRTQNTERRIRNDRFGLRIFFILGLICGLVLTVYSCKEKTASNTQANNNGTIVCLSPNITEIVFALGLADKVAAVSSDSDWPSEAKEKKTIGTFWDPDIETIISCKPGLVITEDFAQQKNVADSLDRTGIKVLSLKIDTIDQMLDAIKKIGEAAGKKEEGEKLAGKISEQIKSLKQRFGTEQKPKVLWIVQPEPLRVAGRKTFINEIIETVGGENAIGESIQQYPQIDTENALLSGADVIIQSAMDKKNIAAEQAAAEKHWSSIKRLPAVKNGRIYVVDPDLVLRLGPRLPEGIEMIGNLLHPETPK